MRWISGFLFAVAVLIFAANSGFVAAISKLLLTIPAPTKEWADIIGHLAWPLTIAWLVVRYRHTIRRLAEIIIARAQTDNLNIANIFSITPQNTNFVPLAPKGTADRGDPFIREKLLEFIQDSGNISKIERWLETKGRAGLKIVELVTHIEYAGLRESAYNELVAIGGGEHG
jgi:hypothetical protein